MVGEIVGSYRLLEKLGSGGMGVVWRAEHVTLGRKAAIKMIRRDLSGNDTLTRRFFNEARSAAQIDHPGLCAILDFGHHTDGSAYIVMELLAGETLGARLRRAHRLPLDETAGLARQIAATLAVVHETGTVHRDLKPDNVFLVRDAELALGTRVKVLDFGIAKLRAELGGGHTGSGAVLGTPAYMAPEQCRGAGQVDLRADVYSLGCILFEMTCGRLPFVAEGFGDLLVAQMTASPPSPRDIEPTVPPALESLILRMLAKKPEERPQTMREAIAALEEIAPRTSGARPRQLMTVESAPTLDSAATAPPAPPPRPPKGGLVVPLALGGAILLGAAVAFTVFTRPEAPAPVAAPDAPALLEYDRDGVRFSYSPAFKIDRTDREAYTSLTLDSPGSPLLVLQIFRIDVLPEVVTSGLESRLEEGLKARNDSFKRIAKEPVRRRIDRDARDGERLVYELAGRRVTTEIYAYRSGLVTYAFLFQSDAEDEIAAAELFRTFAESFRTLDAKAP